MLVFIVNGLQQSPAKEVGKPTPAMMKCQGRKLLSASEALWEQSVQQDLKGEISGHPLLLL